MANDPPASTVPFVPAPRETRQSTSGAVFVVLAPIDNAEDLFRMAAFLEQRAATLVVAGDAERLRNVAARLRARATDAR